MSRRRFGSIRRQRNGRRQARYKGRTARERQGDHTFETRTEAARYLDRIAADMDRGVWSDPHARALTLAAYAEEVLRHRTLAPRTRELYADLLRLHIEPQLGRMPLGKISALEVR